MAKSATHPLIRFIEKVDIVESGCWEWNAQLHLGYGRFREGGKGSKNCLAHRWFWEFLHEPVPKGMHLDHLCRNRKCVNPRHLEVVTPKQNDNRSPYSNKHKTHCPQGHLYDEANTYVNTAGSRECRVCGRVASNRWKNKIPRHMRS